MKEPGSTSLDHAFSRVESKHLQIAFSVWNVGEVLGVLDQRRQRGFLTPSEFSSALFNFADETFRMVRSGALRLVPVAGGILAEAWRVLQEEHIYEADALQIASCKDSRCEVFLSADGNLLRSAKNEGLDGMDPVKDEKRLTAL